MKYVRGKNWEMHLGDCRDIVPKINLVDAIVTDPPYGMHWDNAGRIGQASAIKSAGGIYGKDWGPIAGDDVPFDPGMILSLNLPTVIWGANHFSDRLPKSPGWLVWDKKRLGSIAKDFASSDCELAWCNTTGQCVHIKSILWCGFRRDAEVGEHYHPTQKPIGLMEWSLGFVGGQVVLDPYAGSGTTGVACLRAGREFVGIELDERHFMTACERLGAEEGRTTVLAQRSGQERLFK